MGRMQAATGTSASRQPRLTPDCEGQIIDGRFRLQQFVLSTLEKAVFRTEFAGSKAVIKLVSAASSNPDAQLASWRRAAQLSHPHLIRIFHSGRCWLAGRDLLYVVAEYADENLAEVLPHRRLSLAESESLLLPTTDALSYLHGQGLVHGHLRPGNVMAVYEELKISSDGIKPSGTVRERRELTPYDAPEIALGQLAPPADIWSLGVTLFEALTQRAPQEITTEPGAAAQLPQPFADIVSHCLKKDASARWTADDIAKRLGKPAIEIPLVSTDIPTDAETQDDEPREEGKRRYRPVLLVAGLLAVLALGYGLMRRPSQQPPAGEQLASTAPEAASNSVVPPEASGAVLDEVLPKPSQGALNTIHGTIKVRVKVAVDTAGNVSAAQFTNSGPSKYFARLAMEAAQGWKFTPPRKNGQALPSTWTLVFAYTRNGTKASAEINGSSEPS